MCNHLKKIKEKTLSLSFLPQLAVISGGWKCCFVRSPWQHRKNTAFIIQLIRTKYCLIDREQLDRWKNNRTNNNDPYYKEFEYINMTNNRTKQIEQTNKIHCFRLSNLWSRSSEYSVCYEWLWFKYTRLYRFDAYMALVISGMSIWNTVEIFWNSIHT